LIVENRSNAEWRRSNSIFAWSGVRTLPGQNKLLEETKYHPVIFSIFYVLFIYNFVGIFWSK